MENRGTRATIIPLSEQRDIYMVIDERRQPLGTGTKEVCEFLVELIMRPYTAQQFERLAPKATTASVRSAIRI